MKVKDLRTMLILILGILIVNLLFNMFLFYNVHMLNKAVFLDKAFKKAAEQSISISDASNNNVTNQQSGNSKQVFDFSIPDRFKDLSLIDDSYTVTKQSDINYKNYKIFIFGSNGCPWCKRSIVLSLKLFGDENIYWYSSEKNASTIFFIKEILKIIGEDENNISFPTIILTDAKFNPVAVYIGFYNQENIDKLIKENKATGKVLLENETQTLNDDQVKKLIELINKVK